MLCIFFCLYVFDFDFRAGGGKKNVSQWKRSQWKNQLPLLCISTVRLSFISFYDANAFSPSRLITEWWRRDFFFSFFLSSGIKKKKSLSINSFTESVGSGDCKRRKKESKKALSNELWFSYVLVSSRVWSCERFFRSQTIPKEPITRAKKKKAAVTMMELKKKKRGVWVYSCEERKKSALLADLMMWAYSTSFFTDTRAGVERCTSLGIDYLDVRESLIDWLSARPASSKGVVFFTLPTTTTHTLSEHCKLYHSFSILIYDLLFTPRWCIYFYPTRGRRKKGLFVYELCSEWKGGKKKNDSHLLAFLTIASQLFLFSREKFYLTLKCEGNLELYPFCRNYFNIPFKKK